MKIYKKIISLLLVSLSLLLLFACSDEKTYTVTFNSDGGSDVSAAAVAEREPVGMPAAPLKDKYDFLGWYLDGAEYDFSTPVTSDIQLIAKWAPTVDASTLAGKWIGKESAAGKEYSYELIISASGTPELSYSDGVTDVTLDIVNISSVKGYLRIEYSVNGKENGHIDFSVSDTLNAVGISGGELVLEKAEVYVVTYHTADGKTLNVSVAEGDSLVHPEVGLSEDTALDGWYTADGIAYEDGAAVTESVELYQSVYTVGLQFGVGTVTGYNGTSRRVQIPDYYAGAKVTEIGNNAFSGKDIAFVKFPSGILKIGTSAFRGCSSLSSLSLQGVEHIGEYAFFDCNDIVSLSIPDSVKTIGKGAFGSTLVYSEHDDYTMLSASESSLKTLILPFIGGGAEESSYLAYIFGADSYDSTNYYSEGVEMTVNGETKSVNLVNYLPVSLTTVHISGCEDVPDFAFYNCFYITSINFADGIKTVGESSFEGCYSMTLSGLRSVERIGARAFLGSAFAGEHMQNLTYIGDMAFASTYIQSIKLYPELKYIGDSAFAYTAISEITIPESVEEIGSTAFFGCPYLESVTFEAQTPCEIGSTLFTVVEDGVVYYSNVNIWVPNGDSYKLYREKVNLRDYASGIYPVGMKGESGYVVSDGSLLGYIGDDILDTVSVPEGVVEIADFAFYNCPAITDVVMPEGFMRIGKYAFYNCTSVQNLHIPSTLVEIDDYAFTGFFVGNNISRLYLPEGFKRIGDGAFLSSFNLKIVELPSTLEYIGYLAFGMANSLERMYFSSTTPPTVGSYENDAGEVYHEIFSIVNAGKTVIYVPSGRNNGTSVLDTYRAAEGFAQFADYVKARPDGPEVGHYGDGNLFIDLDGCDTVIVSMLTEAENDTTDFGGTKYEFAEIVGTYTLLGAVLQMELPGYGSVNAIYVDRAINIVLDGESYRLVEPKYYYDSYNWTNFRLYLVSDTEGKGLFDMYGSFLTPFDWKIEGEDFFISIDGNNKLPENSAFAGVVEYKGSYDEGADSFRVSFMLNDYAEIMNFNCERNNVVYASGEVTRLYGTYKAFAHNNLDYAMFTIVSKGNGIADVYIGENLYAGCKYTMSDGVITIDFQTLTLTFTMTKDGHLVGDFLGTDCYFVYVDELLDSTKLPSREDNPDA